MNEMLVVDASVKLDLSCIIHEQYHNHACVCNRERSRFHSIVGTGLI